MPVHVSTGTLSYSFLDLHTPSFSSREQESCAAPRPIAAVRCRDLAPLREFVPHDWRALPTSPDRWLTAAHGQAACAAKEVSASATGRDADPLQPGTQATRWRYHPRRRAISSSVEDARLVGGDHVLDVDEGILTAVDLKHLQRLDDEVSQRLALLLPVVDAVAEVLVL